MVTVNFGRDRYHQHEPMIAWLRENIGPGGWKMNTELFGQDASVWKWYVSTMFGHTDFEFNNAADADKFKEYWNDR